MLIDTHGHVNFNAFKDDASEVLKRALDSDIWVVMPGTQYSTSKRAVEMAGGYKEGVYAAVGLHPIHLGEKRRVDVQEVQSQEGEAEPWMTFETRSEEFEYEKYKQLAQSEKVVAIGEVGLDYYYESKNKTKREEGREKQRQALREQMKLAQELNLPVIFHCRKAHDDLFALIDGWNGRGVVHCYTGTAEQALRFIAKGLYIGFNGLILKQVPALPNPEEVVASIPLERIVLETDSPYLAPPSARRSSGEGGPPRNEPLNVRYVAEEIARIKNITLEEATRVTTQNAKTLFGI